MFALGERKEKLLLHGGYLGIAICRMDGRHLIEKC